MVCCETMLQALEELTEPTITIDSLSDDSLIAVLRKVDSSRGSRASMLPIALTCKSDNGCPINVTVADMAAYHGQLGAIKWLHANGCPVGQDSFVKAAANGHLNVLTWLANELPFESGTRERAQRVVENTIRKCNEGSSNNLKLFRRAKTLDAYAKDKGYWS